MKRLGKGCPVPTKTGPKWRQRHVAHRVQSKRYMTRTELANLIEAAVNASEDYSAKLWAKGGHVRVYLTTCGKDIGFFDVRRDGEIDRTALGNGKHGVAATRILDTLKGAGVSRWRSVYSVEGVVDEFAGVSPTTQVAKGDANHEAQVRMGVLDASDF